jgi:hypothetical protein
MEDFIQLDIQYQIKKCMRVYGIEGTEQKIKELLILMPKLKETFLEEYYKIIKG